MIRALAVATPEKEVKQTTAAGGDHTRALVR